MFKLNLHQTKRHILHVDADAFFATVEQVLNPSLGGKAVLVGGPSGTRGIVSAASYEAKAYGIYSGMPMYLATKKCPQAVIVPGKFDAYRDFSRRMYQIFLEYTPDVEMASIDEAYLDLTGCELLHKLPSGQIAKKILNQIYRKLGLSVSGGLASNKTVAKVASSTNKPHKLTIIPYGKEADFLAPLHLKAMPGVGVKTLPLLESHGFKTIGDISSLKLVEILEKFGIQGVPLWKKCQGIDNSHVISAHALPKSISKENTFYESTCDEKICLKFLKELGSHVFEKLRSYKLRARTIFIKIRYKQARVNFLAENGNKVFRTGETLISSPSFAGVFRDFSFQKNLEIPTALDSKLFPLARELFLKNLIPNEPVRLLGIGVSNLVQNYNLNLFHNDENEEKLFLKIDAMKKMYGEESVRYGAKAHGI